MCDRSKQSRLGLQRGFCDRVVCPFLMALQQVLPGLAPVFEQFSCNRHLFDTFDSDEDLLAQLQVGLGALSLRAQEHRHDKHHDGNHDSDAELH